MFEINRIKCKPHDQTGLTSCVYFRLFNLRLVISSSFFSLRFSVSLSDMCVCVRAVRLKFLTDRGFSQEFRLVNDMTFCRRKTVFSAVNKLNCFCTKFPRVLQKERGFNLIFSLLFRFFFFLLILRNFRVGNIEQKRWRRNSSDHFSQKNILATLKLDRLGGSQLFFISSGSQIFFHPRHPRLQPSR